MATEILRPGAPGDECNIEAEEGCSACPDHYDCVDEAEPDDGTTLVKTNETAYERDLYNVVDHSVGSGTINHVKVYARCNANTSSPTQPSLKIAIKTGGVVYEGAEKTLDAGWNQWRTESSQWDTNPGNAHAWTWEEIDALQIGVAVRRPATGNFTKCTQVYVEVDYTPGVTEKESSDTGSGVEAIVSRGLAGSDNGSGIEAIVARLLAAFDSGIGTEAGGLLKDLFSFDLGKGSDALVAKRETPTQGGGMSLGPGDGEVAPPFESEVHPFAS